MQTNAQTAERHGPTYKKFDDNGRMIYSRDVYGFETWLEYDEDGNLVFIRHNNGFEWHKEA